MNDHEMHLEAFQVIGIKTRTSNFEEMKGSGKIPALWNKFHSEHTASKIPNKLDQNILAVYHDYESDASAPYSLLIGAKVKTGTKPPLGMEVLNVSAQKYFRHTTQKGKMPNIIFDAWKNIWQLTEESTLNRKFSFDLEVYDNRSLNPSAAEVDLLISI